MEHTSSFGPALRRFSRSTGGGLLGSGGGLLGSFGGLLGSGGGPVLLVTSLLWGAEMEESLVSSGLVS